MYWTPPDSRHVRSFGDDLKGQCGQGEDHLNEYPMPKRIEALVGFNVVQVPPALLEMCRKVLGRSSS